MSVLGKSELLKEIEKYKVIHPFDFNLLDGDGYVLTVRDEKTLNYTEHKNLVSHEVVFTPPYCVAHLTTKSKYGRMGLSFLNSVKVHSGFVGRLALELVNLNNDRQPIVIKRGDPLIHIEFMERKGEPAPYDGEFMFQDMTDDEINLYLGIISKNFGKDFDKKTLEKQVKGKIQIL